MKFCSGFGRKSVRGIRKCLGNDFMQKFSIFAG